ncbi:MAG: hypothetical protein MCS20_01675, partial [Candidatus Phytoplasma mali]|nr:hypothetical protein [Candidatus Phytoplasma australiense]MBZ7920103.1 hypothetical protein [Candidatus Karelsulcia muelleri]MCG7202103.1 hypothetical protein [Candidatus Phytoplasma mali]MCZ8632532.1 hypothetical protein [Spiroplasma sp. Tabriz.8]
YYIILIFFEYLIINLIIYKIFYVHKMRVFIHTFYILILYYIYIYIYIYLILDNFIKFHI